MKLVVSLFAAAFGNIGTYGCATPAHLTREAIHFLSREASRNFVNVQRQQVNFLPNLKSSEVFH
jgi:hypothetical protein